MPFLIFPSSCFHSNLIACEFCKLILCKLQASWRKNTKYYAKYKLVFFALCSNVLLLCMIQLLIHFIPCKAFRVTILTAAVVQHPWQSCSSSKKLMFRGVQWCGSPGQVYSDIVCTEKVLITCKVTLHPLSEPGQIFDVSEASVDILCIFQFLKVHGEQHSDRMGQFGNGCFGDKSVNKNLW